MHSIKIYSSQFLVIVSFFLVWVHVAVMKDFYYLGYVLEELWHFGFELLTLALPFILLILIAIFKSRIAYTIALFIFSIVLIIELGDLMYHSKNCFRLFENDYYFGSSPCSDFEDCYQTIGFSSIGFASMNTITLRNLYSWKIISTRYIFLAASILYLIYRIVFAFV